MISITFPTLLGVAPFVLTVSLVLWLVWLIARQEPRNHAQRAPKPVKGGRVALKNHIAAV